MQSDKNRNEHNNVIQTEKVVFEVLYLKGWAQNRGLFDSKFNIVRIRLFWRFQCITSGIYMILLYSNRNLVMHFQ